MTCLPISLVKSCNRQINRGSMSAVADKPAAKSIATGIIYLCFAVRATTNGIK